MNIPSFAWDIVKVILLAMATSAISMTITKATVFKPLRLAVVSRNVFFGELISCPYCMSHWVAFVLVVVYRPRPVPSGVEVIDVLVAAFVMVTMASVFSGMIYAIYSRMAPPKD